MLSFASGYFTSWINSCTDCMVDEVVDGAIQQFPISFPDKTTAKIYFFVVVNREVLFQDDFQILLLGETFQARREASREEFQSKKNLWKARVTKLKIFLGSEVSFVMQGVAHTPGTPNDPWHIPVAASRRENIGLRPHGGSATTGGGIFLPNDLQKIQEMINNILRSYGDGLIIQLA